MLAVRNLLLALFAPLLLSGCFVNCYWGECDGGGGPPVEPAPAFLGTWATPSPDASIAQVTLYEEAGAWYAEAWQNCLEPGCHWGISESAQTLAHDVIRFNWPQETPPVSLRMTLLSNAELKVEAELADLNEPAREDLLTRAPVPE